MPGNATSVPDAEFGEKLALLEGAIGYLHDQGVFLEKSLAEAMGINPSEMKKKRDGRGVISNGHLSRLIAHLGLGGKIDVDDLRLPFAEFRAAVQARGIGIYGGASVEKARAQLCRWARRQGPDSDEPDEAGAASGPVRIKILTISRNATRRCGGMGWPEEQNGTLPLLEIGDQARIKITVPGDGHVVLLNEQPDTETICLAPSIFAPSAEVTGGCTIFPRTREPENFAINGPAERYRIYAIWCRESIALPWEPRISRDDKPSRISDNELSRFVDRLDKLGPAERAVGRADYRVLERKGG